jgi:uncharacterized protein
MHDLEILDRQACKLDYRFKIIFPAQRKGRRKEKGERRKWGGRHCNRKIRIIDSRYTLDYKVAKEDMEYISEHVKKLRELIELACPFHGTSCPDLSGSK